MVGNGGSSRKRRATTSSDNSDPSTLKFYELSIYNPEQRAAFARLVKKKIETTRFPSKVMLQELGLYDNILELFTNIGWEHLLNDEVDRNTYEKVVLEILSTMELERAIQGEVRRNVVPIE